MPTVTQKAVRSKTASNGQDEAGELVFPEFEVVICEGPPKEKETVRIGDKVFSVRGGLTELDVDKMLGWEPLDAFRERLRAEGNPDWAAARFDAEREFVITDEEGQTVCCRNIHKQRPFDRDLALNYGHRMLNRHWAGPTCYPGRTINGSAIEITKAGFDHNGMHRLIGAKFAFQLRRKQEVRWQSKDFWPPDLYPDGLIFDTMVVFGISDAREIIRTIDDCRQRTTADVAYTGDSFDSYQTFEYDADGKTRRKMPATNAQKKTLSRMLAKAAEFVWKRTGQAEVNHWCRYFDHAEFEEFVKRHARLVKAVEHIFEENRERSLSNLGLSPGECAGMLYLMAASKSDRDRYTGIAKGSGDSPPSERRIDFANWEPALKFWSELVREPKLSEVSKAVRHAFAVIGEIEVPEGQEEEEQEIKDNRSVAKQVILAKAWNLLAEDIKEDEQGKRFLPSRPQLDADDITVEHVEKGAETEEGHTGVWVLASFDGFGGIDVGPKRPAEKKPKPKPSDKAELRRLSAEESAEVLRKAKEDKAAQAQQKRLAESPLPKKPKPSPADVKGPKPKRATSNDVNAAQTARALKADQEAAAQGNQKAAAAVAAHKKGGNLKGGL
jgi:hypothetical protein